MTPSRTARLWALVLTVVMALAAVAAQAKGGISLSAADYPVEQDGWYSTMEEVAVYLATYGKLPGNFLTKRQAEALGWNNREGNLDEVAPGCSIGGDHFGNYEGVLPDKKGRKWTECDINYHGGYRGGERIAFSNDGLIYYSNDHYNTFTQVTVALDAPAQDKPKADVQVKKSGRYTSRDEVAAYLHKYGALPENYKSRSEA